MELPRNEVQTVNGLKKQTEQKKTAIIEAARSLFKHDPPDSVGVRDIAAQAGVSTFTIYNYFGSKHGLIFEVVKQLAKKQVRALANIANGPEPFPRKLAAILFQHRAIQSEFHPGFTDAIVADPEIRTYLGDKYQSKLLGLVIAVVDQGKREGYVDSELPNSLIVNLLLLLNNDIASEESLLLRNHDVSDISSTVLEILIYGISGRGADAR